MDTRRSRVIGFANPWEEADPAAGPPAPDAAKRRALDAASKLGYPAASYTVVDVGTQNLGAGLHNVARARTPLVIFAGTAPWTAAGELRGSRDHWIQTYQDAREMLAAEKLDGAIVATNRPNPGRCWAWASRRRRRAASR